MTGYEYRRFPPGQSVVSTFEFHEHRERAPHIDQQTHQGRLFAAIHMVENAYGFWSLNTDVNMRVVDLGCGDGGLVAELKRHPGLDVQGYDFQPSNVDGWRERDVMLNCWNTNFIENWNIVADADLYVCTEVLEHLEEPYQLLMNIRQREAQVVCSSPWMEREGSVDACHNWAWDVAGYVRMIESCGFKVVESRRETIFQVHRAVPR